MLYEIDESCLTALSTQNRNAIAFFEQLALDRRKCKNLVIAERNVFLELSKMEIFSALTRDIYRKLGNRASENRLILNKTKKYCKIIASDSIDIQIEQNEEHEIILLPIEAGEYKDFTSKTIMLAENEEDISFYKMIGRYYTRQKEIGNINIDFEEHNGGGSTISNVLQRIISERNRMCFCIVDSDKKYAGAACGTTMQGVISVTKDVQQTYFEVMLLEIHEIENLIPLSIMETIVNELNIEKHGIEFMKSLIGADSTGGSPIFYFDSKKGIPRSAYYVPEDASGDQIKKYRRLDAYRQYWSRYIDAFGVNVEKEDAEVMIHGISAKILKHTLKYIEERKPQGKWDMFVVDSYLQEMWEAIGERIFCWGCVGSRIAA